MTRSKSLNFTIGEDFGKLLTTIAQEHLVYNNDPIKALSTLTDGLRGLPTDMALKILKGDLLLTVDTTTQECVVCTADEHPELSKEYPKIDPLDFMQRQAQEVAKHTKSLLEGWNALQRQIRIHNNVIGVTVQYDDIFKFIAGNKEELLSRYEDDMEVEGMRSLIETTKDFIQKTSSLLQTMRWMLMNWKEFDTTDNCLLYQNYTDSVYSDNMDLMLIMQQTLNMDFSFEEDTAIESYIAAAREIEAILEEGIKPVNIMDNWSAGWLSPTCEFYGLNGDIANMLHNQIASALQDAGVVPEKDLLGIVNPDSWMEQNGWVKVHGNNIQYSGCLNSHLNLPNIDITEDQVMILCDYIRECHNGILRLGWKMQKLTPTMFLMYFKQDILAFNKTYFEY